MIRVVVVTVITFVVVADSWRWSLWRLQCYYHHHHHHHRYRSYNEDYGSD